MGKCKFKVTWKYIYPTFDRLEDMAKVLIESENGTLETPCFHIFDLFLNLQHWEIEKDSDNFLYGHEDYGKLKVSRKDGDMYEITTPSYQDQEIQITEEDLEDFIDFLRELAIEYGEKHIDRKTLRKSFSELFEKPKSVVLGEYKCTVLWNWINLNAKDYLDDEVQFVIDGKGGVLLTPHLCAIELFLNLRYWKDGNWPDDNDLSCCEYEADWELRVARKEGGIYELSTYEDYGELALNKLQMTESELENFIEFVRELTIEYAEKHFDKKALRKKYYELFEKKK